MTPPLLLLFPGYAPPMKFPDVPAGDGGRPACVVASTVASVPLTNSCALCQPGWMTKLKTWSAKCQAGRWAAQS